MGYGARSAPSVKIGCRNDSGRQVSVNQSSILVLFDIDGTLTRTTGVDTDCFVRALAETYGATVQNTDWSTYPHSTDEGLTHEILRAHLGRLPRSDERDRVRTRFIELLNAALLVDRTRFHATPGAQGLLDILQAFGHGVAIATGAWRQSAELKLRAAQIEIDGIPLVTSDDETARADIVRLALELACGQLLDSHSRHAVYVGDGLWDLRAAQGVGIGFVGIAEGAHAQRLLDAGARTVLADFTNPASLREVIEREARPWRG